jgi:hypothetical protein
MKLSSGFLATLPSSQKTFLILRRTDFSSSIRSILESFSDDDLHVRWVVRVERGGGMGGTGEVVLLLLLWEKTKKTRADIRKYITPSSCQSARARQEQQQQQQSSKQQ